MSKRAWIVAGMALVAAAMTGCKSGCCGECQEGEKATGEATKTSFVNTKCPMTGEAVDGSQTVSFNGQNVAFCCGGCAGKFNKLTDAQKTEKLAAAK